MNSLLARYAGKGRNLENMSQIGDEIRSLAVSLAGLVGDLCHRLAVAGGLFKRTMLIGSTPGMSHVRLVPMPKLTLIRPRNARIFQALGSVRLSENVNVLLIGSMPSL